MKPIDEDDKSTVILDLNALKNKKIKEEEDLVNIAQELVFNTTNSGIAEVNDDDDLILEEPRVQTKEELKIPILLFDFQSDFFSKSKNSLPPGFRYEIASSLPDLNKFLSKKMPSVVIFNYNANPKAINQLTAQIKIKFPLTKTLLLAKKITPEKALLHSQTPSGADGYYQLPIEEKKMKSEILKIIDKLKSVL